MNHVITIGREFGSGGRELGKRLAEELGVAYYDREIVKAIAERSELAESYVEQVLENRVGGNYYPITVANSISTPIVGPIPIINNSIYSAQTDILREMAKKSDCVIVGRCADHILAEYRPLRIFVYASLESRIARCRAMEGEEHLSDKELEKRIRAIDKARGQYYRFYTGCAWGDKVNYDLCINSEGLDLKRLAHSLAELLKQG